MIADLLTRLRALVFGRRWRRELDEEFRFHLEQEEAARLRSGAAPAEARRDARLAFGGLEQWREATRDATGVRPLDDVAADVRVTLRGLRRNPGFTATAVLVLALAIGAATAVFTVVRTVLLSDLPYPRADRLVRVYQQNSPTNRWTLSVVDVQAIRDQQRSFESFGAARVGVAGLAGAGEPEQVPVAWVTAGFFSALGVRPAAGRLMAPDDERPDAPPVAVLSARLASERFGGVRAAVGRTLSLDGLSHTVVGVLPPGLDELVAGACELDAHAARPVRAHRHRSARAPRHAASGSCRSRGHQRANLSALARRVPGQRRPAQSGSAAQRHRGLGYRTAPPLRRRGAPGPARRACQRSDAAIGADLGARARARRPHYARRHADATHPTRAHRGPAAGGPRYR